MRKACSRRRADLCPLVEGGADQLADRGEPVDMPPAIGGFGGEAADEVRLGVVQCPFPADLLEMRAEHAAVGPVLGSLPDPGRASRPLQLMLVENAEPHEPMITFSNLSCT
jgi:hypothetical protein